MFLRGGFSAAEVELGVSTGRMSPCLRLTPTVPAGSRAARKYDPLLLRGNVRFAPIMCVLDASDTIGVFFGRRTASTG